MSEQPIIHTRSLSKYYGNSLGIEDISIQVKPGEIFGFLGPNGAGKTTLIRVLLDLLRPSSGQALLFGLDSHQDSMQTHAQLGNLPTQSRQLARQGYPSLFRQARRRPLERPAD